MSALARSAAASRGAIVTLLVLGLVISVVSAIGPLQRPLRALPRPPEPPGLVVRPQGEDVSRLTPVMVTFPGEPDAADPKALLRLEPEMKGSFAWMTPRTLLFQPEFPGLLRGSTYTVHVPAGKATGLNEDVRRSFTVAGLLEVQQVIPGDGDAQVPTTAQVLVQFSRSVAPLTTLSAQRTEPVIRFDPPLAGKGEWLNTSIYRFVPTKLEPSTTYRMRIGKGIASAADGFLQDDYAWSFSTVTPHVATIEPADNTFFASPSQNVAVTFDQPMDPSAAGGIAVRDQGGIAAPGIVRWDATSTTATFVPSGGLKLDTVYVVSVEKGLKSARGTETSALRTSSFRTVGLPRIVSTRPVDGQTGADRFGVNIRFSNPMDGRSLEGKLRISGFTEKELEGSVFIDEGFVPGAGCPGCTPNGGGISANVPLKPSTQYTVELLAGGTDRYGQPVGAHTFSCTTGELPSSVSLVLPGWSQGTTFSASVEPMLWFQATNLPRVDLTLWPLTPDEGSRLLHGVMTGPFEPSLRPLRSWSEQVDAPKNDVVLRSTSISGGGPLAKGYYFVRTTTGQWRSQFAFAVVDTVLVTKQSTNELVVWALDHDTGAPLPRVRVKAFGGGVSPDEATTDGSGLASFRLPLPIQTPSGTGDRSVWLSIDDGGHYGVASTKWTAGTAPWQFAIPTEYYARTLVGQVYTDRPLYRPGETVEYKAIIRADDDAAYSVPPANTELELVIMNPRGQEIKTETVRLNAFGTFAGSFEIPGDAPIGDHALMVRIPRWLQIAGNSFRVAEFRKPEYQVDVSAARPSYVDGDTIDVRTTASFFFGGALAGAPVEWSAVSAPFALRPKGYERFSFADIDEARTSARRDATRASGKATTDASGVATFSLPAALVTSEGAQQFTIGANVSDVSGQAVAASTQVTVHAAALYAGVRPAEYVAGVGEEAAALVVSVDTDGRPVGSRRVVLKVYDRQWVTTRDETAGGGRRFTSTPKDELLTTLEATTDAKGEARLAYKPTKPGTLRLVAEIADDRGRVSRSAAYLWVWGGGVASWQVTNDDTIKLVADKATYDVGDTAEILVPAPFSGATALITVERGKVITRTVATFGSNSERIRIPVTDGSVPNIFVSVVLYRGPIRTDPAPKYKVGYVQLPVSTASRALAVTAKPDRAQAKPGDTVRYDISVKDHTGRGVKAEISVAVVDKALLALEEERGPDGMRAFWFERGLAVTTASSMAVSMDRANDLTQEMARQGKGGAGGFTGERPRQEFKNVAYWTGQLETRDDGTASVEVKMPDNLTTWRMQVRAVSGDTKVGEGTNELLSTQPLLVRPALPRFMRVGDSAEIRALVTNATSAATSVEVRLAAEGIKVSGDVRTTTVAAGGTAVVSWPAVVEADGTAKLAFSARGSGDLADAITLEIPLLMDVTPETTATGGVVADQAQIEAIYLPPFAKLKPGSLTVNVRSALVGSLAEELKELEPRPYEGAERKASRLIATIGVRRAETTAAPTTAYDGRIASDLAAVVGRQRPDGGWAWCDDPLCESDPRVSAWALLALGEARRDGAVIDSGVVSRATQYVLRYVFRQTDVASPADASDKAFMLAALAAAGAGASVLTPARALFEQDRARLASWGRAYLLLALDDSGIAPDDPMMRALLNDLAAATIPTANGNHWEDPYVPGSFMTRTSTTGLVTLALARLKLDHALLPQSVRWLIVARGAQSWHTSIDRAMAVLGLMTYSAKTGELGGEYEYSVALGDKALATGTVAPGAPLAFTRSLPLTTFTPGKFSVLSFSRDYEKPGRLYYTLDLRYVTPAQGIEAVNRGFAVSHEYTTLADATKPIASVKLGETVRVKVTVMAPSDRSYVTVEDLLPAGLEAVDARLRTIDPKLKAQLDAERRKIAEAATGKMPYAPWYSWYYSPWQHVELRDDRAVLYAQRLPKGVYEYVYYARATTPGDFFVAPAHASEQYFPDVFGRSDSGRFTVSK